MFPPKEKSRLTGERNSAGMLLVSTRVANKRLGGIGARYTGLVWSATRPLVVVFEEIHRSFASKKRKRKKKKPPPRILERERGMKREREREKMAIPHDRIPARTSWRRVNLTFAIRSPPKRSKRSRNVMHVARGRRRRRKGVRARTGRRAANPKGEGCARHICVCIKIHEPSHS